MAKFKLANRKSREQSMSDNGKQDKEQNLFKKTANKFSFLNVVAYVILAICVLIALMHKT